jgi:hypothetical protein
MNPTRRSEIQSGVVFFWNHLGVVVVKDEGAILGLGISFVVNFS